MKPNFISEKAARTKYIRNLEKFFNQAVSILKRADFDSEIFKTRVLKNFELFSKTPPVTLHSAYTKELESFVNSCLDFTQTQQSLINKANAISKLKNAQTHKKPKHKGKIAEF